MHKKLIHIMKMYGITQLDLSRILNVTPKTIVFKLNGRVDFKLKEVLKIKEYVEKTSGFKFSIEELFTYEEEKIC